MNRTLNLDKRSLEAIVGLSLFMSWPYSTFFTSSLSSASTDSWNIGNECWIASVGFLTITLCGLAFFDKEATKILRRQKIQIAVVGIFTLGNLMVFFGSLFSSQETVAIALIGASLTGISTGFLRVLWGFVLARFELGVMELIVPVSFALGLLIAAMIASLPDIVNSLCVISLVVVGGAILVRTKGIGNLGPREAKQESSKTNRSEVTSVQWLLSGITIFLLWIAIGFIESSVAPGRMLFEPTFFVAALAGLLVAFSITYLYLDRTRRISFMTVFSFATPMLLVSLFLIAVYPSWSPQISYTLCFSASTMVTIFIWILGLTYSKKGLCSTVRAVAGLQLFLFGGAFVSSLLGLTFYDNNPSAIAAGMMCFIASFVILALPRLRPKQKTDDNESVVKIVAAAPTQTDAAVFSALSKKYGLTPREAEVMELFANGRDAAYIRDKLYLSRNTVNSHLKHIYVKMKIHSKQELIDMVEEAKSAV